MWICKQINAESPTVPLNTILEFWNKIWKMDQYDFYDYTVLFCISNMDDI